MYVKSSIFLPTISKFFFLWKVRKQFKILISLLHNVPIYLPLWRPIVCIFLLLKIYVISNRRRQRVDGISFWTDGSKARKLHCATKKKVSCEEERPVDSDSWGPTKQPYVGRFSRSVRRGEFSTPKVWDSCYFCLILSFVMISMKIFATWRIDWCNWKGQLL